MDRRTAYYNNMFTTEFGTFAIENGILYKYDADGVIEPVPKGKYTPQQIAQIKNAYQVKFGTGVKKEIIKVES